MRILGVDPGSVVTGWGVIERRGNRLVGVAAGVIRARSSTPFPTRLHRIHEALTVLLAEHRPDAFAIEDVFQAKFARSALKLGQARGVALLAAAQAGLPIGEYAPSLVKRTITGRGQADKNQVAHLVGAILGWKTLPELDASDALAIAITHAQASRAQPLAS
ncbi:MAG: crossover junction endodeoxyribonuclease RuvC [Myxococcales bacterium]|nr:crossover junction endodeoxyribonuclease RuvC [Myxococcales bacterium]